MTLLVLSKDEQDPGPPMTPGESEQRASSWGELARTLTASPSLTKKG